jgi:hypothetical protein
MCYDCYHKIYRGDMTIERIVDAARLVGVGIFYDGDNFTRAPGRAAELDGLLTDAGCVGQARRDLITRIQDELERIALCKHLRKLPSQYRPKEPCPTRIVIDNCLVEVQ